MTAGQWILVIVGGAMLLLLTWWWLHRDQYNGSAPAQAAAPPERAIEPDPDTAPHAGALAAFEIVAPEPDDLTRIEGIGPKISALLQAASILTFAQLAAQEPAALREIIAAGGVRIGAPATWPEQAALAAAGRWDELTALQASLKGGRRT